MVNNSEDGENSTLRFSNRFGIPINVNECQGKFTNRILNALEYKFEFLFSPDTKRNVLQDNVLRHIASKLGRRYEGHLTIYSYLDNGSEYDFYYLLQILEALYEVPTINTLQYSREILDSIVSSSLSMNEMDLGIQWNNGIFRRVGAGLLDDELIKKSMTWLSESQYENVLNPFRKGLSHFLESSKYPERLSDTVTDMYEAIEALAKIVTGNDRDLSANRESFISKLKLNRSYGIMLKEYINYANEYRHAVDFGENRETPLPCWQPAKWDTF